MYKQVEKTKENKSKAVANSVTQKKSKGKQGLGFVDNRVRGESGLNNNYNHTRQLSSKGNYQQTNVIQLAGHKDVMIFKKERIVKRVEKTEYAMFKEVKLGQERGDPGSDIFPIVFNCWAPNEITAEKLVSEGYDKKKAKKFISSAKEAGEYFIEMENMTNSESETEQQKKENGEALRDYKLGTFTAEKYELVHNGHKKNISEAAKKQKKMIEYNDEASETSVFGIRDEDEFKNRNKLLVLFKAFNNTMERAKDRVKKVGAYNENDAAIKDLRKISKTIEGADAAFVASSIVFYENNDKRKERVRLIDLAHPIKKIDDEETYQKAKRGMLGGVNNLIRVLMGEDMKVVVAPDNKKNKEPKIYPTSILQCARRQKA